MAATIKSFYAMDDEIKFMAARLREMADQVERGEIVTMAAVCVSADKEVVLTRCGTHINPFTLSGGLGILKSSVEVAEGLSMGLIDRGE